MRKKINMTIEDFLLEELDYMAQKRGMNRSQLIAHMVSDEWIEFLRNGNVKEDYFKSQALEATEAVPFM